MARYPQYAIVKEKVDRPNGSLSAIYDSLRFAFADAEVDEQDGLRLSWPDRWVHIRPSGTEPVIRVIAEARTRLEAQALITRCGAPLDALSV